MDCVNLFRLVREAPLDHKTGIRITRIRGDDTFSLYAAEIAPHTRLRPHYHGRGIEIYHILDGSGIMRTGRMAGPDVTWTEETAVERGDCFTIEPGMVHQLENRSSAPLMAAFICSPAHVGEDRFFVE